MEVQIERFLTGYSYLAEKPNLSCYNYLARDNHSLQVNFGEAIATFGPLLQTEIPTECQNDQYYCEISLTGYQSEGEISDSFDQESAEALSLQVMQLSFPRAKNNCDQIDCFNLAVSLEDDSFHASADYQLPLLSLLGQSSVKLSYQGSAIKQEF